VLQDIGRGSMVTLDPFVRVLLLNNGTCITSRSTGVAHSGGQNPSFIGFNHLLEFTLPSTWDVSSLSLVAEIYDKVCNTCSLLLIYMWSTISAPT
jgi:hypothetical protein